MFTDQNGACAYCQKKISQAPADFDADHIIPVKHGGRTVRENLHLLCVSCHRTKSALERRTGATTHASESVLLRTEAGFPPAKPADFPRLRPGIYSLYHGLQQTPRPEVKRVGRRDRRIMRPATVSSETTRFAVVHVLHTLVRQLGFNGLHDTTTEICLKHVDMKNPEVDDLIRKLQRLTGGDKRNTSLSGILIPWLKRYAGVRFVRRQAGKKNKLCPCLSRE